LSVGREVFTPKREKGQGVGVSAHSERRGREEEKNSTTPRAYHRPLTPTKLSHEEGGRNRKLQLEIAAHILKGEEKEKGEGYSPLSWLIGKGVLYEPYLLQEQGGRDVKKAVDSSLPTSVRLSTSNLGGKKEA